MLKLHTDPSNHYSTLIDPLLVVRGTQTQLAFQWVYCTHLKRNQACSPVMRNLLSQGTYKRQSAFQNQKLRRKVHFDNFAAVSANTSALSNDFSWENKIFQNLLVNMSQCAGHGTRLFLTTCSAWFTHNATLTNEHDMAIRKFLLEFTSQSRVKSVPVQHNTYNNGEVGRTVVGFCWRKKEGGWARKLQ